MKQFTTITALTITFLLGQPTAQGQTKAANASFPKPGFGSERARVEFLVGTFATATYMPPMPSVPRGDTGKGTSVITWVLDSMFLSIEDQNLNALFGHYKSHGMLGYESQTKQFVLSMFNNFGDHPTYRGTFVGDTLVLQTTVPMQKGSFDQKLLWYKDGGAVRLSVLNDFGKGPLQVLEQTATPVPQRTK